MITNKMLSFRRHGWHQYFWNMQGRFVTLAYWFCNHWHENMQKRHRKYNKYDPLLIKIMCFCTIFLQYALTDSAVKCRLTGCRNTILQKSGNMDVVSKKNTDARANCHSVARRSSLKILISSHKISISGIKILISGLKISISSLKISISSHKRFLK